MCSVAAGCGSDSKTLDDYLPDIPSPTGEARAVWAGEITSANPEELIDGPASSGMVGDFYLRNSKGRFVVQAATRVIGVVPQGGNLVDAIPLDENGDPAAEDHFGELSLVYLVGRTCRHDTVEVVQDGAGGGAAAIVARGMTEANDFINLRGIGLLSIPLELDPDIDDGVECATTYILEPGSEALQVSWTLFNPGDTAIKGPFGALNDTGGEIASWGRTRGFERLGIEAITSATDPAPTEYVVYQGPGVAYGVLPRHDDPNVTNSTFLVQGVSIVLYGAEKLLDILNEEFFFLDLPAGKGVTHAMDISVGHDAADAEEVYFRGRQELVAVSGQVTWETGGGAPSGARVGLFQDVDSNGALDAGDLVVSYFAVADDGTFSGMTRPGNYLLRAEVLDQARSTAQALEVPAAGLSGVGFTLPNPVQFDYDITDFDTGNPIPGKITVIGRHPAAPDQRVFDTYDRKDGVVRMVHAIRGSSSLGEMPDPAFALPPGTYRIVATRGTEWSVDSQLVTVTAGQAPQTLDFSLKRVVDTTGYVSSEYHVHQVGSPDSPVLNGDRIRTAAADGIELFSSNDHDYVTDLQPYVEAMSLTDTVRTIPGLEVTPFTYGHFNAWPIQPQSDSPNRGAVDWARGMEGYAMIPDEIFGALRTRGAELVQVNHPRVPRGSISDFMQFFDRAGLSFDFDQRLVDSDLLRQPVPNDWMRLPEASLWSDAFNALEVWNGFSTADYNDDDVREISSLDIVMRDWFNFLTMGMKVTPLGNSDTHTAVKDPMGMPRTMVAVTDDSPVALTSGNIVDDVLDTLAARNDAPVDIVVTNGPFIKVTANGGGESAIGRVVDGSGGLTLDIEVTAPAWAEIDTIELFANETLEVGRAANPATLQPRFCFTARTALLEADTCALASGGARALTVTLEDLGDGFTRYRATAQITLAASDIENRTGATGEDAWFVVRVYGTRAVFPILLDGVVTDTTLDALVSGTPAEQDAVLDGAGVPATAFTAPIYVDFDGGGYRAVFRPD